MNYWNVKKIESILEKCGQIAVDYYENPGYELKSDKSIVTEADKAVEEFLASVFNSPETNSFMIGEETISIQSEEYINKALQNSVWIIDPIDGTAPYSHHIPTWGISIAFAQNGIIKEGAVFLPVIGEMFISENENIYYKKRLLYNNQCNYTDLKLLDITKIKRETSLISVTQETTKFSTFNVYNPVQSICCAVFSLTQLLQKRYMAYILSKHIKLWDFAAGLALLQKAGLITKFKSNDILPLKVSELCNLDRTGADKWKLRSEAVFALTDSDFEYIIKNISF